ncbi:MAG: flagellar protein FliT [Sedimenticola sp.]|nr:flagellar protein FliT [Sedimenticola sp.]
MLEQILETSRKMLALAEQDEWEQAEALQRQRQELIEKTFPLDDETAHSAQTATLLKQILSLDGQLRRLAESRRKEIGRALGKISQGRQATRAYRDTSRG